MIKTNKLFSSPHGDFSFSIVYSVYSSVRFSVFVPSRGFLFFYSLYIISSHILILFSSPHGDFSFSMAIRWKNYTKALTVFVPSRGFLFFYITCRFRCFKFRNKFSSPHGDFSFSIKMEIHFTISTIRFSSPHGDFSFSISTFALLPSFFIFVFVPSRGFLFFYKKSEN